VIEDKAEITRPCNRRDTNATMVIKEDKAEKTRPCKRRDWTCNNGDKRTRQRKLDHVTEEIGNATMVIEDKAKKTRPCNRRHWKCNNGDRGQGREN